MTRSLRSTAALGLLLAAAVAPAAAQAAGDNHPHVPVPPGQLQHTVTVISFPAGRNTHHHDGLRNERWITATAGREITTDLTTHKVRSDCQYRLTVARCWDAPLNATEPRAGTTFILPGDPVLLQSWIDLGANVKALLGDPRGYRLTGTTTLLGRPAVTLVQDAQRGPDGGIESTTVIAEADNFFPLRSETLDRDQPFTSPTGHKGHEQIDEVETAKVLEAIPPAGVKLTIARHPHAKIKDERHLARHRSAAVQAPPAAPGPGYNAATKAAAR